MEQKRPSLKKAIDQPDPVPLNQFYSQKEEEDLQIEEIKSPEQILQEKLDRERMAAIE